MFGGQQWIADVVAPLSFVIMARVLKASHSFTSLIETRENTGFETRNILCIVKTTHTRSQDGARMLGKVRQGKRGFV